MLLTARGSTGEKVTALRAGADDYLVKPFDFAELLARLEALNRRNGAHGVEALGPAPLDPAAAPSCCATRPSRSRRASTPSWPSWRRTAARS
jgi:two-component system OmpR family response regulator